MTVMPGVLLGGLPDISLRPLTLRTLLPAGKYVCTWKVSQTLAKRTLEELSTFGLFFSLLWTLTPLRLSSVLQAILLVSEPVCRQLLEVPVKVGAARRPVHLPLHPGPAQALPPGAVAGPPVLVPREGGWLCLSSR